MPRFSQTSLSRLATVHPDLRRLFNAVIKEYDCIILAGHRGQAEQDEAYRTGRSQLPWPRGKHNATPSLAVDAAPHPLEWGDSGTPEKRQAALRRFYHFAGYVQGMARALGIPIRYGGDWDRDFDFSDNRFNDLVHFELAEPPTRRPGGAIA